MKGEFGRESVSTLWDRRISLFSSLSKRLHGTTIIAIPFIVEHEAD